MVGGGYSCALLLFCTEGSEWCQWSVLAEDLSSFNKNFTFCEKVRAFSHPLDVATDRREKMSQKEKELPF